MSPSAILPPRLAAEKAQHTSAQRAVICDTLRQNLSVAIHAKEVAETKKLMLLGEAHGKHGPVIFSQEEQALRNQRLTACDRDITIAESAVTKANQMLVEFETAEEMRKFGRLGELVMALVVDRDDLYVRLAAAEQRIVELQTK